VSATWKIFLSPVKRLPRGKKSLLAVIRAVFLLHTIIRSVKGQHPYALFALRRDQQEVYFACGLGRVMLIESFISI